MKSIWIWIFEQTFLIEYRTVETVRLNNQKEWLSQLNFWKTATEVITLLVVSTRQFLQCGQLKTDCRSTGFPSSVEINPFYWNGGWEACGRSLYQMTRLSVWSTQFPFVSLILCRNPCNIRFVRQRFNNSQFPFVLVLNLIGGCSGNEVNSDY